MACWLGGLVVLCVAVLPRQRRSTSCAHGAAARFSALALGCVVRARVTGGFQAWRQVGSLDALQGHRLRPLLIVKLVVFAALIVAAAFSREIVNRRFRDRPTR